MSDELLTVQQAAKLLDRQPCTVMNMCHKGKLKATRKFGFWLIDPASVEEMRRVNALKTNKYASNKATLAAVERQNQPRAKTRRVKAAPPPPPMTDEERRAACERQIATARTALYIPWGASLEDAVVVERER